MFGRKLNSRYKKQPRKLSKSIRRRLLGNEQLEARRLLTIIDFIPGSYTGDYNVNGTGNVSGASSVDLPAGQYSLQIATSIPFTFDVDAVGNVTSNNADAAVGGSASLTFNTTTISIDPTGYSGDFRVERVTGNVTGPQSAVVVPNVNNYRLQIATSAGLFFDVDASGNISTANTTAASTSGSTITLATTTVSFDPSLYLTDYRVERVTGNVTGPQSAIVVPNISGYNLQIATSNGLLFDVDASGNISTTNTVAASTSASTLTLNSTTINLDPALYSGDYRVERVTQYGSGPISAVVVPNIQNYGLQIAEANVFRIDVDAAGNVSSSNTGAISTAGNTATFNTSTLNIDPNGYTGLYRPLRVIGSNLSGSQSFTVVPNVMGYRILVDNSVLFTVDLDAAGIPTPASVPVTVGPDTFNFLLSSGCTTTVSTFADGGPGSLREAILCANATPGPDTITLAAGTYAVTIPGINEDMGLVGDLDITDDLTIVGAGQGLTFIDGGDLDRVFHIPGSSTVDFQDLTVQNGAIPSDEGGGILNFGTATLTDVMVTSNEADTAGGIASFGDLTLQDSSVTFNLANTEGGGIISNGVLQLVNSNVTNNEALSAAGILTAGTADITDSSISDNFASDSAGGIQNGGTVNISGGTISNNFADAGFGGGIFSYGNATISDSTISGNFAYFGGGINSSGSASITDSVISNNEAQEGGGGVTNYAAMSVDRSTISDNYGGGFGNYDVAVLSVSNSTISGNYKSAHGGGGFYNYSGAILSLVNSTVSGNSAYYGGGGIQNVEGQVSITNSTIAGNSALDSAGGGIANSDVLNMNNSIVANNTDTAGSPDVLGLVNGNNNLVGDGTGGTITGASNQVGTSGSPIDPLLGTPQNNGGPTLTLALQAGSPAIDAGDNTLADDHGPDAMIGGGDDTPLTLDQRGTGFNRVAGGTVDLGAVELQQTNVAPLAEDDSETTNEDTSVIVDALSNDTDDDGNIDPASVAILSGPGNGSTNVNTTTGEITYTPFAEFNGTDVFTYEVCDTGGLCDSATVTVTVNPVNDEPSFSTVGDQNVVEDSGPHVVPGFASASPGGGPDEASQTFSYNVSNDNNSLFSSQPSLDDNGELTYTLAANQNGTAVVTLSVTDSGGTANGGDDSSPTQTFLINVQAVNDAPEVVSLVSSNPSANQKADSGQPVTISGTFADVDVGDSHTVVVDWGDGTAPETLTNVDQVNDSFDGSHSYATGGIFKITITVTDNGGVTSNTESTSAYVTGVGLVGNTLYVIGTDGNDYVDAFLVGHHQQQVKVITQLDIGGGGGVQVDFFDPADIDKVRIVLCDGNDYADIGGGYYWYVPWYNSSRIQGHKGRDLIFGGLGNDKISGGGGKDDLYGGGGDDILRGGGNDDYLFGGGGNDALSGGAGNDLLVGNKGADILIGGMGEDKLYGGKGDDLLIGGTADNESSNSALQSALASWILVDLVTTLAELGNITDDNEEDDLFGQQGLDELIGGLGDNLSP